MPSHRSPAHPQPTRAQPTRAQPTPAVPRSPRSAGSPRLAGLAALAACSSPGDRWAGSCPAGSDASTFHVAAIELSPSELDDGLLADRLVDLERHVGEAIDCDADLEVLLLANSQATTLYEASFDATLGTESARDLELPERQAEAMAEIERAIAAHLADVDAAAGSDPGAVYRAIDNRLVRLSGDAEVRLLVLSDGVTETPAVSLNRPIRPDEVGELAAEVAPPVDLGRRVHVDWPDIGRTADPRGAPGDWLDLLAQVWEQACLDRQAATCLVTGA